MITRNSIVTLAQTLCYGIGDTTEMTRIFDELMIELGQDPRLWITAFSVFDGGTIADPTDQKHLEFPLSLNLVRLLALFFDGRQLSQVSIQELDAMDQHWRDRIGDPIAYVTEDQNDRQVRLYPQARVQTSSVNPTVIAGRPSAIYTETRITNIMDGFELPLAWLILGREFARESPHRDVNFAGIATALGEHYLGYLT